MNAWETILAAVGGLLLGLGLGLTIGRRGGRAARLEREAKEARLRTVVLPVLERRASELGAVGGVAVDRSADAVTAAVTLATAIQRSSTGELAYSDTVSMDATRITKQPSKRPPAA